MQELSSSIWDSQSAINHSERLLQHICQELATMQGEMVFDHFMELALYAPGLGYYAAGMLKLGPDGDFITAPEVSPLFGRTLAHQYAPFFRQNPEWALLEFGPGSGSLALSIVQELMALDALPARYCLIELSPELRQRQQRLLAQNIPDYMGKIEWLSALPSQFSGIILANEVLDAMPVHCFRIGEQGIEMLVVAWDDNSGTLITRFRPAQEPLLSAVLNLQKRGYCLTPGYCSEINLRLNPWIGSLAECLVHGIIQIIDYGYTRREYYHPARDMGTLLCHSRHQAHDNILQNLGLQDITAHVDFTALAESGQRYGLSMMGFTNQANFLLGGGMLDLLEKLDPAAVRPYLELTRQIKILTLPGEMGDRFKVMVMQRGDFPAMSGFSIRNSLPSLYDN